MIQFHVYPNGLKRIVTFSYDDGNINDKRLVGLFNKYKVKGTFHLNGMLCAGKSEAETEEMRKMYRGHEISCHTARHGWPARMPNVSVVNEIMEDRRILEKIAGYPVCGMSYPSGSYNENVLNILNACGIVYSRTVKSTGKFLLPDNFLEWHPTCHHRDAAALCDDFLQKLDSQWAQPLFYIWGHSHEFKTEEDWAYMERLLDTLSGNEKIWYATNIEIYRYMTAQQRLVISADENIFYNPSDITVWVEKNKQDIIKIPAGETVILK